MKTYKAPDNSLHVIDPEFAHMLPAGCLQITDEEAKAIRAANAPQPDPVQLVKDQIAAIERDTLMNRATREFMIALAEKEAAASGYTPAQLYAVNLGYRKIKDIDTQVAALREQIGVA